ncbi:hypothetical protein PMAYCL1PPCAC_26729, partial [Pristionchus mayeri]
TSGVTTRVRYCIALPDGCSHTKKVSCSGSYSEVQWCSLNTTTSTITSTTSSGSSSTTVTSTTTSTKVSPTTTIPRSSTPTTGPDCCPALTQSMSPPEFADGSMTFSYNNNTSNNSCLSTVIVTCSQTDPSFEVYASIVANGIQFLDYLPTRASFPGKCSGGLGTWALLHWLSRLSSVG